VKKQKIGMRKKIGKKKQKRNSIVPDLIGCNAFSTPFFFNPQ
jgi:hypothetical protein